MMHAKHLHIWCFPTTNKMHELFHPNLPSVLERVTQAARTALVSLRFDDARVCFAGASASVDVASELALGIRPQRW